MERREEPRPSLDELARDPARVALAVSVSQLWQEHDSLPRTLPCLKDATGALPVVRNVFRLEVEIHSGTFRRGTDVRGVPCRDGTGRQP